MATTGSVLLFEPDVLVINKGDVYVRGSLICKPVETLAGFRPFRAPPGGRVAEARHPHLLLTSTLADSGIALPSVTTARDAALTTAVGGRLYRTCSGDSSANDGVVCGD